MTNYVKNVELHNVVFEIDYDYSEIIEPQASEIDLTINSVKVGGVEIYDFLESNQMANIQTAIFEVHTGAVTEPENPQSNILQKLKQLQSKAKPIINNRFLFGTLTVDEDLELRDINNKIFETIENI